MDGLSGGHEEDIRSDSESRETVILDQVPADCMTSSRTKHGETFSSLYQRQTPHYNKLAQTCPGAGPDGVSFLHLTLQEGTASPFLIMSWMRNSTDSRYSIQEQRLLKIDLIIKCPNLNQ